MVFPALIERLHARFTNSILRVSLDARLPWPKYDPTAARRERENETPFSGFQGKLILSDSLRHRRSKARHLDDQIILSGKTSISVFLSDLWASSLLLISAKKLA